MLLSPRAVKLLQCINMTVEEIRQNHSEIQMTSKSITFRAQACLQSGQKHLENMYN